MDAELAQGRHAALAGELEALVAEHPLRERPRGQLMTALYRSGRQADALAAYRAGRESLVAELGIEPGADLQELERAILRQDPALDLPGRPRLARRRRRARRAQARDGARGRPAAADPDSPSRGQRAEIEIAGGRSRRVIGDDDHGRVRRAREPGGSRGRALTACARDPRELGERRSGSASSPATRSSPSGDGGSSVAGARSRPRPASAERRRRHDPRRPARARGNRGCASSSGPPGDAAPAPRGRAGAPGRAPRPDRVGRSQPGSSALDAAYRACVADGRPYLVTIAGDAGVGKTRLVRELRERLAAEAPAPRIRAGRCIPYGRGITLPAAERRSREELGLLDTDQPDVVLARLGEQRILGLTLGLDSPPRCIRSPRASAWRRRGPRSSAASPRKARVVVLLEDLHWAQDALLDLVERLHSEVQGPLLLLATSRPELLDTRPAWGRRPDALTVWLEPLPAGEAELLLELVGDDVPEARRAEVLDRAEGNPFFLEELAQARRARGPDPGLGAGSAGRRASTCSLRSRRPRSRRRR